MIKLTEQEQVVLTHLYTKLPQKQIAYKLGVTARTIKAHCGSIYRKLEIQDRVELMAKKIKELEFRC